MNNFLIFYFVTVPSFPLSALTAPGPQAEAGLVLAAQKRRSGVVANLVPG